MTAHRDNILKLRAEGKSYKEIKLITGASLSTISYHCGAGQKLKTKNRTKNHLKTINGILKRKKDNFHFLNGNRKRGSKRVASKFSSEEFKNYVLNNQTCYLTGEKIDILEPKTYNCDHIIPVSRGGTAELSNLGLALKRANMAKGEMLLGEFLELCEKVLTHHGYEVFKK